MNKKVFRNLSYGVYVVSTLDGERHTGCVVNSIMQITSSPAAIALSMNHDNFTNSCIQSSGRFAVSILSEHSDPSLIGQFGFQSGKTVNKFENIDFHIKEGLPVLNDCCGYMICKVVDKMETSSHTVFLGEVIEGDTIGTSPAMTYAYYHNVVKGKSPKNAPTYIDEQENTPEETSSLQEPVSPKWVCGVCGYVYEGSIPFSDLPDSYICPICRQSKDKIVQKQGGL